MSSRTASRVTRCLSQLLLPLSLVLFVPHAARPSDPDARSGARTNQQRELTEFEAVQAALRRVRPGVSAEEVERILPLQTLPMVGGHGSPFRFMISEYAVGQDHLLTIGYDHSKKGRGVLVSVKLTERNGTVVYRIPARR
jgi:hypothetical protein